MTELTAAQDWDAADPPPDSAYSGAGDAAFARIIADPAAQVAFHDDPAQEALVRLKIAATRILPVQSVRSFFGLGHFGRRVWFYHELRGSLTDQARAYWDAHEEQIRAGLLGQGRRELAIARFRTRLLPLAHNSTTCEALFSHSSLAAQRRWAEEHWFTPRWRLLARVHPLSLAIDEGVRTTLTVDNFQLQWRVLGRYLDLERGPAWLTTTGHRALRAGLDRIDIR